MFDDPLAASRMDTYPHEERWHTVGTIGTVVVLVVHTTQRPYPDAGPDAGPEAGNEVGRIVSARKATPHERRAYEEGTF